MSAFPPRGLASGLRAAGWLSLLLAAQALGPGPARAAPAGAAPTSAWFRTSDGVRLHYLEAGRGRPIVFVTGWTFGADLWARQLAHFAPTHRVVALDPRSQGRSQIAPGGHNPERRAADIAELIEALGADRVVLVGWSLGVLEALAYVRQAGQERLAGLVLVDNSVGEQPPPEPTDFMRKYRADRRPALAEYVRSMFRHPQPEAFYEGLVAGALRTPYKVSLELLSTLYPRDVWRRIVHSVERPLLYAVTPEFAAQAHNLRRHRPGTRIEVFPTAGHALFYDEPQRFNAVLADFLATVHWGRG